MATSTCDRTLMVSLAALQRNLMLGVFGMNATDRTHLAEISIESSLCEIVQAEEDTKQQLRVLIDVVRKRDVARQSAQLKADLVKSSKLRKTLCALQQKRTGMETQMDKLRESKLNMQMLQSMKHTNIALQNIGLKVSDADAIMLDLEEAQSDAQDLQNSLSSSFANDDDISHLTRRKSAVPGLIPTTRRRGAPSPQPSRSSSSMPPAEAALKSTMVRLLSTFWISDRISGPPKCSRTSSTPPPTAPSRSIADATRRRTRATSSQALSFSTGSRRSRSSIGSNFAVFSQFVINNSTVLAYVAGQL